jgi:hypothetical protein
MRLVETICDDPGALFSIIEDSLVPMTTISKCKCVCTFEISQDSPALALPLKGEDLGARRILKVSIHVYLVSSSWLVN